MEHDHPRRPTTGNQTLSWNAAGQLSSVTSAAGTTSYVYDGDGNLLLQQDPASWTLYLPGEQLTLTNPGGTNSSESGARIIPLPSGGDVVRTGATTSYYFEIPDIRGTSTLYLDNTAQTPTWLWWRACTISPQSGACSGQFKASFSGLTLNTRLEGLINHGFGIRLNNQGNITGLVLSGIVFGPLEIGIKTC